MTVLLTGGAGYIGSHTAVELLSAGYDVIIADNYSNSKPDVIDRIAQITGKYPRCYRVDITDRSAFEQVFSENTIESVIHFAGLKAVGESVRLPLSYYHNNLDGAIVLLELMNAYRVHQLIFSSSATVYGSNAVLPYREDSEIGPCTNPYGWTKLFTERIISDFAAAHPLFSVVMLRYFNPVGAHKSGLIGEDPRGIPNNLMPYIAQVAAGTLPYLRLFGNDYPTHDGTGVRDYIHVTDLACGHIAALRYAAAHSGTEIINLGSGRGYSVLDMVHAFSQACGHEIPYQIFPRRSGDVAVCYADTSKAQTVLNWHAQLDIDEMCRSAWVWQNSAIV